MRAPSGQIDNIQIFQRSQTSDDVDEGTTTASTYHRVGSFGSSVQLSLGEGSAVLTCRALVGAVKEGHVLLYRKKWYQVKSLLLKGNHTNEVTAVEVSGGRCVDC